MKLTNTIIILSLVSLAACGGGGGGGGSSQNEQIQAEEASDGVFHAHLRPTNPHSSGFLPHGGATFSIDGDKLVVKTYLDDDGSVTHRQSVHSGTRCPGPSDDMNGDGFIDYQEALRVAGPVLIPLDADLSSQDKGADVYPRGTGFSYTETVSRALLMEDIWGPDSNPSDEIAHLSRGSALKLVGRIVLVHGTNANSSLPSSIAGRGSEAANLSLPVVCGVIFPLAN